ncbi:MAG: hypothetical protein EDX89_22565 [Acidobacteria bacterium]|nr:MAG: hypothetical protein EDX89_22565 [Acidobacteriota bacterium]
MTIAISLKVNDGLVLAADSASTFFLQGPDGKPVTFNVYNHANKVFNLVKGLPIGVITWGAGSIGTSSIETLMKDLRLKLSTPGDASAIDRQSYQMQDVAKAVRRFFFDERYHPSLSGRPDAPELGFIIAGYSSGQSMAEEFEVSMRGAACPDPVPVRALPECGLKWAGMLEPISRLILGYGTGLPNVLEARLGVPREQVQPAMQVIQQSLEAPLVVPPMPIQDAIDLAEFLVELTAKFYRFLPGAQSVGGPIEIAVITKHEHFKWIKRKHYYSSALNPPLPTPSEA